jgi:hypothetical protein
VRAAPTKLRFRIFSGVDHYRWKESITKGGIGRQKAQRVGGPLELHTDSVTVFPTSLA